MKRVLFVHGALGDARIWQPVIDALPDGLAGEALTLTYFGKADWPDDGSGFATATHAADIVRAARRQGNAGGGVTLVSWSMGTHPALQALIDAPGLFDAALFYEPGNASFVADPAAREAWQESFAATFSPIVQALAERGAEASADALLALSRHDLPAPRRALYHDNARTLPLLMGGQSQPPARLSAADCATIAIPATVAMGAGTPDCFAIPSRTLAAALPRGELRLVENADHFLPENDPVRFARLVAEFSSAGV